MSRQRQRDSMIRYGHNQNKQALTNRKSLNYSQQNSKEINRSILDKYKFINASQRKARTQANQEIVSQNMSHQSNKFKNDFSQEYLMLVNKLRVNLSKNGLQSRQSRKIIREKQSFFLDEHKYNFLRPKNDTFSEKNHNKSYGNQNVERRLNFNLNQSKLNRYKHEQDVGYSNDDQQGFRMSQDNKSQRSLYEKKTFLPPMKKNVTFKPIKQNIIKEIEEKNKNLQLLKTKLNRNFQKTQRKYSELYQNKDKRQIKLKQIIEQKRGDQNETIEKEQIKQSNEIDENYDRRDELCLHLRILIQISQQISRVKINKEDNIQLGILLKNYVLGNKQLVNNTIMLTDNISHLQDIYTSQDNKGMLKTMVFYERILVIFAIDLVFNYQIDKYINEIQQVLHAIIGIYLFFIYILKKIKGQLSQFSQISLKNIQKKVIQENIHMKKDLYCNNLFIAKKMHKIFKSNKIISEQITILIIEFQKRNVSINRSFYELLKLYAIYLNNYENIIEKHYNSLKTFATCPSPYLIKPNNKKYSLVLDLDQTLLHTSNKIHKLSIFMRPYVKEFLSVMSKNYEIIIFTSSMPQYSESIMTQLPYIQHKLYRYHTTRLKNRHIKDLNRIGRPLSKTIIIDNDQENFVLQKDNGIKIVQWTGQNQNDQELNIIGLFLTQLVKKNIQDVRQQVPNYKQFRKKYI